MGQGERKKRKQQQNRSGGRGGGGEKRKRKHRMVADTHKIFLSKHTSRFLSSLGLKTNKSEGNNAALRSCLCCKPAEADCSRPTTRSGLSLSIWKTFAGPAADRIGGSPLGCPRQGVTHSTLGVPVGPRKRWGAKANQRLSCPPRERCLG